MKKTSFILSSIFFSLSAFSAQKTHDACVMSKSILEDTAYTHGKAFALVNKKGDWRVAPPGLDCSTPFSTDWQKVYFTHTDESGKKFYWAFKKNEKSAFSSNRHEIIEHFGEIVELDLAP